MILYRWVKYGITVTVLHRWRVAHSRAVKIAQNHIHVSHILADKRKDDLKRHVLVRCGGYVMFNDFYIRDS